MRTRERECSLCISDNRSFSHSPLAGIFSQFSACLLSLLMLAFTEQKVLNFHEVHSFFLFYSLILPFTDHTFDVVSKKSSPYSGGSPGLIPCHTEPHFKGFSGRLATSCYELLCVLSDRLENATEKALAERFWGRRGDAQWGTSWSLRHMHMHEASIPHLASGRLQAPALPSWAII